MSSNSTYFTLIKTNHELPFSILNSEGNDKLYLYSNNNGEEYKFLLENENNIIKLANNNPFEEDIETVNEKLTTLYSEFIESNSIGYQSTEVSETDTSTKKPGYGPDEIFVENKPFSLKHIIDLIEFKDIEISPDFQRNFIWDKTRQSRLIESILLGLPLPSIYLSQYDDGTLTIVDGLQRISTIYNFYNDKFTLTNLEYLHDCNGKKYSQLSSILSPLRIRRFAQTQVMCFVIDYRSPNQLKFDLFRRLNTGGKPLNNQEIRNCLSNNKVQKIIREMINLKSFKLATSNSILDKRMDGRDAALRFICFYEMYNEYLISGKDKFKDFYNGDMEKTLDDFVDILNTKSHEELNKYVELYDDSLLRAYTLFKEHTFRKLTPELIEKNRKPPINKLLMLSISVLLTQYKNKSIDEFENLKDKFNDYIYNDDELYNVLSWGTNGKNNVEVAFDKIHSFLTNNI